MPRFVTAVRGRHVLPALVAALIVSILGPAQPAAARGLALCPDDSAIFRAFHGKTAGLLVRRIKSLVFSQPVSGRERQHCQLANSAAAAALALFSSGAG